MKYLLSLFIIICFLSNCNKNDDSGNSNCDKTYIYILVRNWKNNETGATPRQYELNINSDKTYTLNYKSYQFDSLGVINDSLLFFDGGKVEIDYCHVSNVNANGGHYPGEYWDSGIIFFMPEGKDPFTSWFKLDVQHLEIHDVKIDTFCTILGFGN